jgi:nucleotide-binding universal stress UspA family protein
LMLRPIEGKTRREASKHLFKDILVPLDGSGFSEDIIDSAVALAKCSGAALTLLRVVLPVPLIVPDITTGYASTPILQDDVATERLVAEARDDIADVARRLEQYSLKVETEVVVAPSIAQGILDVAESGRVDAIAMSTHGRGISRFLIGSVADKVLRGTRLPILLHRPTGVHVAPLFTTEQAEAQLPALSPA